MLVVRNDTTQDFYLRAPHSTDPEDPYSRVAHVPAGAQGRSVEWYGMRENEIEVLNEDCERVGEFESDPGQPGELIVFEVPMLTGRIEPYHFQNIRDNEPIESTGECGGFIYL